MLAIQYPWYYVSVFEEFCDFHVVDANQPIVPDFRQKVDKEFWIDVTRGGCWEMEFYEGIILPFFSDPDRNLLNLARNRVEGKLNIGIWDGEKRHLRLTEQAVDIVALPNFRHGRTLYITPEEAYKYHAYEFCNLDELRRYPFKSLHTSIPIISAIVGIDLTKRDRRPRRLPEFSYDLKLNEQQLELAYNNCQAIKEAMEHARQHHTLHT